MSMDYMVTRFVQHNVGGLRRDLGSIAADFVALEAQIAKTQDTTLRFIGAGAIGFGAITSTISKSLQSFGEVQRVQAGYETILGSLAKAKQLEREVRAFDIKTPFTYIETAQAANRLLAAGFREDLIPAMTAFGNAVVASGGDSEKFLNLATAMSKLRFRGFINYQDIRSFVAGGIPVKDILMKKLGLTEDQIFNIGHLHLRAETVLPALIEGLEERFGGGIDRAQERIIGALDNLKGTIEKMMAGIGETTAQDAMKLIKNFTRMATAVDQFVSTHQGLTKWTLYLGAAASASAMFYGAGRAIRYAKIARDALIATTTKDIAVERTKTLVAGGETRAMTSLGDAIYATFHKARLLETAAPSLTYAGSRYRNIVTGRWGSKADFLAGPAQFAEVKMYRDLTTGKIISESKARAQIVAANAAKSELYYLEKAEARAAAVAKYKATGAAADAASATSTAATVGTAGGLLAWLKSPATLRGGMFQTSGLLGGGRALGAWGHAAGSQAEMMGIITKGGALMSGALGLGAGLGTTSDLKALGVSQGKAQAAGIATGVGAAAAAMFIPGAAIPIAIAEGFRLVFDKVTDRIYDTAEMYSGNGLTESEGGNDPAGTGSDRFKYGQKYLDLAARKRAEADAMEKSWTSFLHGGDIREKRDEAKGFETFGLMQQKLGKGELSRQQYEEAMAAQRAREEDAALRARIRQQKYFDRTQDPAFPGGSSPYVNTRILGSQPTRNGSTTYHINHTIEVPGGDAFQDTNDRELSSMTPYDQGFES